MSGDIEFYTEDGRVHFEAETDDYATWAYGGESGSRAAGSMSFEEFESLVDQLVGMRNTLRD